MHPIVHRLHHEHPSRRLVYAPGRCHGDIERVGVDRRAGLQQLATRLFEALEPRFEGARAALGDALSVPCGPLRFGRRADVIDGGA